MKEVQVWENVIKWELAQSPEFSPDPEKYAKEDFDALKNTIEVKL
jgi:hypothetical protein